MTITFRPVDTSDMPRLAAWLMAPHVRQFYQPAPITLDEVTAEYAPMIGNDTPTICHFAVSETTPFAYVQSYRNLDYPEWAEMIDVRDGISVDLFIGEPAFLHRGMGRVLLVAYLKEVAFAYFAETRAYIAHATANASALRCSQAAGFRPVREFLEDGVPTLLLMREAGTAGVQPDPSTLPRLRGRVGRGRAGRPRSQVIPNSRRGAPAPRARPRPADPPEPRTGPAPACAGNPRAPSIAPPARRRRSGP